METKMTALQRIQLIRSLLADEGLAKGGKNKHNGTEFWQLADFVPFITKLCVKHNILPAFSIEYIEDKMVAVLRIYDSLESVEVLKFSCPTAKASLPKAQEIMNRGAEITYLRRYLHMMAFEITEPDLVDNAKNILIDCLDEVDFDNLHGATSIATLNTIAKDLQKKYPSSLVAIEYDKAKKKLQKPKAEHEKTSLL